MSKLLLNIMILFMCGSLSAQDTVYQLVAPIIVDSFHQAFSDYNQAYFTEAPIKTLGISGPLSEMLLWNASGITRSNGPGKVTTFSKHGLPAEHTRVYWNDIELNSPLNGIVDFSTLPTFLLSNQTDLYNFEDVRIHLKSTVDQNNKTRILFNTGSFEYLDVGIKQTFHVGKTVWNIGGEYIKSKSNFKYKNDLRQKVQQVHGNYKQFHGSLGLHLPLSKSSSLSLHALYSDIQTNIPPTFFQRTSNAYQENYPLKLQATYNQQFQASSLSVAYGANIEYLRYENPDLRIDAQHKFWRNNLNLDYKRSLKHDIQLHASIIETFEVGKSDNFNERQQNLNTDISVGLSKAWLNKLIFTPKIGVVYGRNILSPLQFKTQLTYILHDHHRIRGIAQSLFRMPTYNELYWNPGGNRNLSPEAGHALLLDYFLSAKRLKVEIGMSLHRINDRILWLPQNSGIFSPINVGDIGSEEIHTGLNVDHALGRLKIQWGLRYTYLNARILKNTQTVTQNGKNLPFSPRHMFTQHIATTWNGRFTINFNGKYQSKSYTDAANTAFLKDFYLFQGEFQYRGVVQSHAYTLFLKINNITNSTYLLSNGYPQPPRHWQAGFTISLNQKE